MIIVATNNKLLGSAKAAEYCGMNNRCLIKAIHNNRINPDHKEYRNAKVLAYYFSTQTLDNFNATRKKVTSNNNHDDTKGNVSNMNNEENTVNNDVIDIATTDHNENIPDNMDYDTTVKNDTSKLNINQEFKQLITKPSDAEYAMLKDSIAREGIREPITVWNNTIIDGHNRHRIACELNIPTIECRTIDFNDKEEAKEWIIRNQLGRRNISKYERCRLVLNMKDRIAAEARERMLAGKSDPTQKSAGGETRQILARIAGVSHDTLQKVEVLERKASLELKERLRAGTTYISAAYRQLKREQTSIGSAAQSVAQSPRVSTNTQADNSVNNSEIVNTRAHDTIQSDEPSINVDLEISTINEELQRNEDTITNSNDNTEQLAIPDTQDNPMSTSDNMINVIPQNICTAINGFMSNVEQILRTASYYSTEEDLQRVWTESVVLKPLPEIVDKFVEKLENSNNVRNILLIVPDTVNVDDIINGATSIIGITLEDNNIYYVYYIQQQ